MYLIGAFYLHNVSDLLAHAHATKMSGQKCLEHFWANISSLRRSECQDRHSPTFLVERKFARRVKTRDGF